MSKSVPPWKQAERDFEGFFNDMGKKAYVHRLTDTAAAKATGGKGAFVVAQPSDYIGVMPGITFFGEVKSSQDLVSFPHSNIKRNQLAQSRRIIAAGGSYLFFIKSEHFKEWFLVPAQFFIANIKGKKSTKWTDLAEYKWNPNELS